MGNLDGWDQFLTFLAGTEDVLLLILRILVPLLSLLVIVQCFRSVRRSRRKAAPVVMLENIVDQTKIPVLYWENSIGRSKSCDITVPDGTMSRDHAVLMRREAGWEVIDTGSKSGTRVNGVKIKGSHMVLPGDRLTFGSTTLMLIRAEGADSRPGRAFYACAPHPAVFGYSGLLWRRSLATGSLFAVWDACTRRNRLLSFLYACVRSHFI